MAKKVMPAPDAEPMKVREALAEALDAIEGARAVSRDDASGVDYYVPRIPASDVTRWRGAFEGDPSTDPDMAQSAPKKEG